MDASTSQAAIDPYQELPQASHIKSQRVKFTTSAPFTPIFVESQLTHSSDPSTVYASRVQNRQIALENPARTSRAKQLADQRKARQSQDAARKKSRLVGRKDTTLNGVWDLKAEATRYELFLPLHQLWKSYIAELLGLSSRPETPISPSSVMMPNLQAMQAKLVKADYHGSMISVRRAKNPCLVGCSGIVIYETENTFKVVSADNKLKVIPKHNSVFAFTVPLYLPSKKNETDPTDPVIEFELHGDQFAFRSTDRATRKFKQKVM